MLIFVTMAMQFYSSAEETALSLPWENIVVHNTLMPMRDVSTDSGVFFVKGDVEQVVSYDDLG